MTTTNSTKKKYQAPKLKKYGQVREMTLKTGSIADFAGGQYKP